MNNLTIEIYSTGTTKISDPGNDLNKAQGIRFSTGYPGGLYLDGSFYIPRDVLDYLPIKGNYRVVFRNGLDIVYEGWVDGEISILNETDQGVEIPLIGAWGRYLMRRNYRKNWADDRVSDDVWRYKPTPAGEAYFDFARLTDAGPALLFNPNNIAMVASYAQVVYTMPTGETVKQITGSYDLTTESGAEDWILGLYNIGGTLLYTIADSNNTAGTYTGTFDHTLGTAAQNIGIRLVSQKSQTPAGNGSTYGEITDLVVYSETSDINLTEIATDIIGLNGDLNSDTSYLDAITDTGLGRSANDGIIPFVIDRWTSHADILTQAAAFGDDSFNNWAFGCLSSEKATTPNGEAVLFCEQQPALTDYDYAIRIDEPSLVAPFGLERDYSKIWNWIIVEFYDSEGRYRALTPDDSGYSALKDTTSISAYGQRDGIINVGNSTVASAFDSGQRFLAKWKDPQYKLSGPITVVDYIRKKDGSRLPASEIVAGKRVKVENYLQDLSGTGLTFLISHTDYDDENETCSIQAGIPDDLIFPTFVFSPVGTAPGPSPVDSVSSVDTGVGGVERLNWKRQYGLSPGTPEWDEAVRLGKQAWLAKYPNAKRTRR